MSVNSQITCASDFAGDNEPLSWNQINSWATTYGDSFYVFKEATFRNNFTRLSSAFTTRWPDTRIAYSYKTNYMPAVCEIVSELGAYAEVVSEMEYDLAERLGVSGERIIYNGPYKSLNSLQKALYAGSIVNLDSMRDYENVMTLASEAPGRRFSIGMRCNFALGDDCSSRFGFDSKGPEFQQVTAGIRSSRNVSLTGVHCHFPNRDLASFKTRALEMLDIVKRVFPSPPEFVNLGGGFFGGMPESMRDLYDREPPDFNQYAETICTVLNEFFVGFNTRPTLYIEPGTALVADTMKFYVRVIDIKNIRGRVIATVAGSLFNISPHSRVRHLPVRVIRNQDNGVAPVATKYDIAGYTCIENDYLTVGLSEPLKVGDFLEYGNVGSYSIVLKPPFILPNVPILAISADSAEVSLVRHAESSTDLFASFPVTRRSYAH